MSSSISLIAIDLTLLLDSSCLFDDLVLDFVDFFVVVVDFVVVLLIVGGYTFLSVALTLEIKSFNVDLTTYIVVSSIFNSVI